MYLYIFTNESSRNSYTFVSSKYPKINKYLHKGAYLSGKYLEITIRNKFNYVTTKMINNFIFDHFGLD